MRIGFSFRPKGIAALLALIIAEALFAFFMVNSLNVNVVHSDLYNYGLIFDARWADEYWNYLHFLLLAVVGMDLVIVGSLGSDANRC